MKSLVSWLFTGWLIGQLLVVPVVHAAEPTIRLEQTTKEEAGARFILGGLASEFLAQWTGKSIPLETWQQFFAVYAVIDGKASSSAMLGEYEVVANSVVFVPRFPPRMGMTYRAVFEPSAAAGSQLKGLNRVSEDFRFANPPRGPATRLTEIYPSGDVLPENLLRLYIHFSAPMSRGEAYEHIRLVDESGKQIDKPFLELNEELWSPDGMRFTLYFDPGRIKRGLQPRELFGPPMLEGHRYTLVIDKQWLDAQRHPLAGTFEKKFRTIAPDDTQPDPKRWKLTAPVAGTRDPLIVEFDEALDSAMLERVLDVRDASGESVAGEIAVDKHERRWRLTPKVAWETGSYQFVVATNLEDVAGNSIRRPFEVDILRRAQPGEEQATVALPFAVGK